MKTYLFDEWSLQAMFQKQSSGIEVKQLFGQILDKKANGFVCSINIGELYALNLRQYGFEMADKIIKGLLILPIKVIEPSLNISLLASDIKSKYPISFPQSYIVALAIEYRAIIVSSQKSYELVPDISLKLI
jgi:uncharacterized protein